MAEQSKIEWTDSTWNPVTGCTRVSPGCAHCYIERTPPFRMNGRTFARVGNEETTGVMLHHDRLEQPLHWTKPRRVFVCSLADLFHDDVPVAYIAEVFGRMALAHRHVFQVLTKRPEGMREVLTNPFFWAKVEGVAQRVTFETTGEDTSETLAVHGPLPNVWLGVSIENARYTWRADVLREIPAALRFISAEPLLESLYPTGAFLEPAATVKIEGVGAWNALVKSKRPLDLTGIDWIIVGGESGPGARPMRIEWAREIIRRCDPYEPVCCGNRDGECCNEPVPRGQIEPVTAVFVKQLGSRPTSDHELGPFPLSLRDSKGGDWDEWPPDLRVRDFPASMVAA